MAHGTKALYSLLDKLSRRSSESIEKVFLYVIDMSLVAANKRAMELFAKVKDKSLPKEEQEEVRREYNNLNYKQERLTRLYNMLREDHVNAYFAKVG